uniref:trypsin n=1 Tax=Fundulus heteroclitus TaxID=8078 RepID=A0A3Q2PD76_FUNHE
MYFFFLSSNRSSIFLSYLRIYTHLKRQFMHLTGASASSIFGGKVSKPHSRPYMASLQYQGSHICGGILIRKDFVLTAAHCLREGDMTVVLGAHDLSKAEKSQQRIKVAKFIKYPQNTGNLDFDIMLLKLDNNATTNKYVKHFELPKKGKQISDKVSCVVAGWGTTGPNDTISNVLKEGTETTLSIPKCKNIWKEDFNSEHMICTTFTKKKGGICQGDSGGPLICKNKLQGITSYTDTKCDNPVYPHVFMKVNFFLPWIDKMLHTNY